MNQLTDIANALSDPNRVRLLAACLDGERCVCQLVELIELSNASVSKHLSMLKRAGLLESRKEGRWVHYKMPESPAAIVEDSLDLVVAHALHSDPIYADRTKLKEIDAIDPVALAKMQREGCCPSPQRGSDNEDENEDIREQIRSDYASIATSSTVTLVENSGEPQSSGSCCHAGACGVTESIDPDELAQQIGYTKEELAALPADANMGLSCGNPTVIAALKEGEVILDLGSGGGFDVFLAGPKVGKTGRAIGIDMTHEMLSKARKNIGQYRESTGLDNVEFLLGEIEHLPVADESVDVIISNCVLNLSMEKPQVWREIARVLKPGGRVAVSDIALLKPLPSAVKDIVHSWAGCVAGAELVEDTRQQMIDAGLSTIELTPKSDYVDALVAADDELYQQIVEHFNAGESAADVITSLDIQAIKPFGDCCGPSCCS